VSSADLSVVVTNARVGTGDPARPWATALGLRNGQLAVVGSAAEILKMAGTHTRIIDAHGQTLDLPVGAIVGSPLAATVAADDRVTLGFAPQR
jgi:hypothetical protein